MDINRNNYEAFLLDLLEGRLSVEEEKELKEFLKHHPEHVVDLPDLDLLSLEKSSVSFPGRDQLRKEFPMADTRISQANFDMFSIARMEGDLIPQQEEEHQSMISENARRLEEWSIWQKTRLVPERIQFQGKKSLKRKKAIHPRVLWISVVSAAASVALLFVLLRVEPAMPGPEISRANTEEFQTSGVTSLPVPDPSIQSEQTQAVASEEVAQASPEMETIAMPDKKVSARPAVQAPQQTKEDFREVDQELLKPRPIRIAQTMSPSSAMLALSSSDRIEPLPVDPVSANLSSLSVSQIAELDRRKLFEDFTEENNISLLSVANAGIKGINKLTGSEISLLASRDDAGEISGFRLKSKRFSVTSPLSRQE